MGNQISIIDMEEGLGFLVGICLFIGFRIGTWGND